MDSQTEPNLICDGIKAPSLKPPESIIVTYYTSPVDFFYISCQKLKESAHLLKNLEKELVQYCTPPRMKEKYAPGQDVIVRYLAWSEPRMIRGHIIRQENEEYLVGVIDYSFTICCVKADMWPLPDGMSKPILELTRGGVASIVPYNGKEWFKFNRQLFGKLLENAIDLIFEEMYVTSKTNYGKLTIRSSTNEAAFDGASFLLDRKWASSPTKIIPMDWCESVFGFDMAEMNHQLIKPSKSVAKTFELVDNCALTMVQPTSHLSKIVPDHLVKNGNLRSNDDNALSKPKIWSRHQKYQQTSTSSEQVEQMLRFQNKLVVPDTAKRFCKVNTQGNTAAVGSCLDALKPKKLDDPKSEQEIDALFNFPFNLLDVPTSVLLAQRSTSVDKTRHPLSTSVDKAKPPLSTSVDQAKPPLSTSMDQAKPPLSTSMDQPRSIKPSSVSSRLIYSAATSKSGTDVQAIHPLSTSMDQAIPPLFTSMDQPRSIKPSSVSSRLIYSAATSESGTEVMSTTSGGTGVGEIFSQNSHHSNELTALKYYVLAHSLEPATPINDLNNIPIWHAVKNEMYNHSIYSPSPLQQYAWPHLCNGGSMILINSNATCRTWSYLPIICSTVQQSCFSAPTSPAASGPLAILVTDSQHHANTLFRQVSNLMQNQDKNQTKIVNGHDHSERDLSILLLNSFSILVTTLSQLHTIIMDKPGVIDKNRLLSLVLDDFQTMQENCPEIMDDVMHRLNDLRNPKTQIVIIAQKWQSKPFGKLLKSMPNPLILFGNFLEAAMYGQLVLRLSVQGDDVQFDNLLSILEPKNSVTKRTLIFFKTDQELRRIQNMLLDIGYKCIGILKAEEQQPNQLLLVSDQQGVVQLPNRNIEMLIHYSFPTSWSKFAHRFHAHSDIIPNLVAAPLTGNEKRITSVVLLNEDTQAEYLRLVDFLHFHDIPLSEKLAQMARACQEKDLGSRQICPNFLNEGSCHNFNCYKRHEYIPEDMPDPENPLMKSGTVIRARLNKIYEPDHMSMWPLEYRVQGQDCWIDVGHHISYWTFSLQMSMGERKVLNPYRLHDVCVVIRHGQVQRVRIVDIPPRRPVVVQQMDHGSELLYVKPNELLQCPDEKFTNQPAMALNIRLSGVEGACRRGQKWSDNSKLWTHEMLSNIGNNTHLQVIVDFSIQNVIHVKEIALVEECPSMRTSIYKLLLSKELVSRRFAKLRNKDGNTQSKAVDKPKTQEEAELETNKTSQKSEVPTSNSSSEDAVPPPVKYFSPITDLKNYVSEKKHSLLSQFLKKIQSITAENQTKDHPKEEVIRKSDAAQICGPKSLNKESSENLSTGSKVVQFVSDHESDDELYEDPSPGSPKIKDQKEFIQESDAKTHFPAPEDIQCITKESSENPSKDYEAVQFVSINDTDDELYEDPLTTVEKDEKEQDQLEDIPNESYNAFLKALTYEVETMSPSKKQVTKDFLSGLLDEEETEEPPKAKPVKSLKYHKVPNKDSNQEPSPEDVAASLQCGVIANGSVNPKVKWHQDLSHIDLVIEQKVPEYKLILKNNSLIYMVSTTSPPQCCILNLLGEVAIESEKQIGYNLHIKLAKVGLIRLWPSLLSSFYAQQIAHWLTYNTELDQEPELSEAIVMWDSFQRRRVDREEESSTEDYPSNDESDSAIGEDL
ncbi:putative ATP-dependent RNA helicase SoYb [Drosophila bipectinata]|uniref:putative ATP-dependent RNA helicase SoYb n=1 Tax=Drosophila bipectinata TaxID=42026 RepID=UPI001C8AF045|nr:putative ATP-dependent RNA helicase SoYb [Drosophila bipectinata]